MNAEPVTETAIPTSTPFFERKFWGLGFFPWMVLSWLSFALGIPLWSALTHRDMMGILGPLHLEPELVGFYSFIWFLWLIPLVFLAIFVATIIELFWKRTGFVHKLFFTGTPILIGGMLLHSLLWPNRIENRFTADWKIPFPNSAEVIHIELKAGWLWSNSDVFHLRVRPQDLESIIESRALTLITPDENMLEEISHRRIPEDNLKDWQWYYLPPPEREHSDHKYRRGQSYLVIANPSRTEAFFYNNYHD
jgi:hypothetical protein